MTSTLKTLVAIAALTCAAAVSAQELKIGFVNLDRVLRDAAMAKAAQAKLESEFTKREKELLDGDSRLKNSSERLERDSATLGESERGRRQRDLMEQDRELQRKRREFQEDLIVQESVFASSRVDITDKVIKAMNAGSGK